MDYMQEALAKLSPADLKGAEALAGGQIPKIADLTPPIRDAVESAYGHAIGNIFLYVSPAAVIALIAIIFIPNIPLSTKSNAERLQDLRLAAEKQRGGADGLGADGLDAELDDLVSHAKSEQRVLIDPTGPIPLPPRTSNRASDG